MGPELWPLWNRVLLFNMEHKFSIRGKCKVFIYKPKSWLLKHHWYCKMCALAVNSASMWELGLVMEKSLKGFPRLPPTVVFSSATQEQYICYRSDFAVIDCQHQSLEKQHLPQRGYCAWSNPSPQSSSKPECCGVSLGSRSSGECGLSAVQDGDALLSSSWDLSCFTRCWWVSLVTSGNIHLPFWVNYGGSGGLFPCSLRV